MHTHRDSVDESDRPRISVKSGGSGLRLSRGGGGSQLYRGRLSLQLSVVHRSRMAQGGALMGREVAGVGLARAGIGPRK